jgi:hypothetical protein
MHRYKTVSIIQVAEAGERFSDGSIRGKKQEPKLHISITAGNLAEIHVGAVTRVCCAASP